jgi:D-3-phosphoglycerate dehydrogenase
VNKQWDILIISDLFVTGPLFQASIERELDKSGASARIHHVATSWPDEPLHDVEEVREAVGDVDAIAREAAPAEIIATDYGAVTRRIIEAAPQLRLIAVARGGPVSISLQAAQSRGIKVVNLPGRNSQAVAEFTLGMILAQVKRIAECHADMKRGIWRGDCYRFEKAPRELAGQTAGIIGFGNVGRLLAPLLRCLGMDLFVHDPYIDPGIVKEYGVDEAELDVVLKRSDVVSLHARVTPENVGMIGEKELRKMKASAYLINTARGALVDYKALYRALKERWIAGAALDIYDMEPIGRDYPLLELDNVTCTPHIGGSSRETAIRSADLIAAEIARFIQRESAP